MKLTIVMEKTDYLNLNIKQLHVLVTIHGAGSLSAAAKILDMNQSTVSYWLDQSRDRFDDPLFVRVGQGMRPTERMEQMLEPAREVLHQIRAITEPASYIPSQDRGSLRISCSALERDLLLHPMIQYVSTEAPQLRLEVSAPGSAFQATEKLVEGELDLVLYPDILREAQGLYQKVLYPIHDAVFFDPAFPLAEGDIEAYCSRPHARIALGPDSNFDLDQRFANHGRFRQVALQVADFDTLASVVRGTQMVATLPKYMRHCSFCELDWIDSPWPGNSLNMAMFWHARHHGSARHKFWRDHISNFAAGFDE